MKIPFLSKNTTLAAALSCMALLIGNAAAAPNWNTDYEETISIAAKEKKDILINFTSSDACFWCAQLKKEVFSTDTFKQEVLKHFTLLELDFPQTRPLPEPQNEHNIRMVKKYGVTTFPGILLTDSTGRPYAFTSYLAGGPENYNQHLTRLRGIRAARDESFAKAAKLEGLEKAKALHEGMKKMDEFVINSYYQEESSQIAALDTADTLGIKAARDYKERRMKLEPGLIKLSQEKNYKEFIETLDAFIKAEKLTGENLQEVMMIKLEVMADDLNAADALLDEVLTIDPDTNVADRARSIKLRLVKVREKNAQAQKTTPAGEDPVVEEKDAPKDAPAATPKETPADAPKEAPAVPAAK